MSLHHRASSNTTITEELATTNTPTLEQEVPLQNLCRNCHQFFQNWDVLDWLQSDEKDQDKEWPVYSVCTLAECRSNNGFCHLCTRFCFFLERSECAEYIRNRPNLRLAFKAESKSGKFNHIAVSLKNEDSEEWVSGSHFDGFVLREYEISQVGAFYEHLTARKVPFHARNNIQRAKRWIETCSSDHQECRAFQKSTVDQLQAQRPTRVLEVTENKVRLRCDMGNEHFDYVVLSHMWGDKKKQLRLLEQNFLVFQREVPQAKLDASSTFKEAIRITRILGYRYLWIDSLCIIQDVPSDWKYEAHRMATVYGNAICNLSFLFPPGDEPEPRCDPRAWIPCVLRPASSSRPGIYMEHETNVYTRLRNSNRIPRDWPLFGRAWTFQEYLLSPRTLLIGSQNLMWQCSRGFYDELLGPVAEHVTTAEKAKLTKNMGKSRYFPRSIQTIAKASSLSEPSVLDFMIDWQNLINEYQARRLTVAKDRVVAFAGIARAFQNLGQLTYLAGAWKEVFPLCLLWFVDKKTTHQVRYEDSIPNGPMPDSAYTREIWEPVVQPAPSWSWFSVPIYRYYKLFFVIGENEADISYENELSVRCRGNLNPSRLHFDDIFWVEGCKFQFGSSGPNCFQETGFYEFADLQVTLEMPVLPVKVNWPQDIYEQLWWIQDNGSDDDRDVKWMLAFNYYPDVPFGRKSPPRNAIYALIAEYQIVREAGFQRRLAGLMLIPGPQPGTWTRNGVWMLKIRLSNVLVTTENIPSVAQRWRNYAIISSKWHTETITLV